MAEGRLFAGASVLAPWWLGLVFVVSISADAGQDATSGASVSPLSARAPLPPEVLVPVTVSAAASGDFGRLTGEAQRLLQAASLVVDDPSDAMRLSREIQPRIALRGRVDPAEVIDRHGKGEPMVGVRPTFETELRRPGALPRLQLHAALFGHDAASPVGGFSELDLGTSLVEPSCAFEPWPEGEGPTALSASAETPPDGRDTVSVTMRPAAINERLMQGATLLLSRADVLASMTPARADLTPVEVVAHASLPPSLTAFVPRGAARTWAAFDGPVDQDTLDKERRCLAEAIYFEARGESEQGQAAVAQVVLNRVSSGLYPTTICGVVYQNRHRLNACQFSFACDGRRLHVNEPESWRTAMRIAAEVTNGRTYVSDVGASTHYHADYVRPRWAAQLEKMDVIGRHIFYKLQSGQN